MFVVFHVLSLGLGFLWKMPWDLKHPILLQSLLHNIIGAYAWQNIGVGPCNSTSLFGDMLHVLVLPVLPLYM